MSFAPLSESIDVNVAVQAGRVAKVDIRSARAFGLGRLAAGRSAGDAVAVIGRLFSLCATAHRVAAVTAIEAARAERPDPNSARARIAAVIAERLVELLRGTLTMLAAEEFASLAPALRRIGRAARSYEAPLPNAGAAGAATDELAQALATLGLAPGVLADAQSFDCWLSSDSVVARRLRPLAESEEASFGTLDLDPLEVEADRVIGANLREHGAAFSARPALAGQIPETGALARNARHPLLSALVERHGAGLLARLVARLVEVCETPARLRAALIDGNDDANADVVHAYSMGKQSGLAAVQCARGRLYHLAEIADDGGVERLEILAPTEWNFHPQGSLARALNGACVGIGAAARLRVERLVAAFDPCVAVRVDLAEAGRA